MRPDSKYLKSYGQDLKFTTTQPGRWQTKDWLILGGVMVGTGLLFQVDKDIQCWSQEQRSAQGDQISKYLLEPWGSGLYPAIALSGLYLLDGDKGKTVALQGVKAWILTAGATVAMKQLFHRQRPYEGEEPDPFNWHGPYGFTSDYTSFPSGHTSTIFAVATVVAKSYKEKKWVAILSYSIATLTGASRVYDNKHWASDVFVGGVLGYFVGNSIIQNQKNIQWGVDVYQGKPSFQMVWHF